MQIKCIFDTKNYSAKPKHYEVGSIINRMTIDKVKDYSTEEIKKNILNGNTVRPSYCGGKENSWQSQQLFMIDVDDGITINETIQLCEKKKIIPNFIYTSFSHKEEHHKFRLVFIFDKVITDYNIAKKIQLYLMDIIECADERCKNLNRIYYAGKDIVFDSNNILNTNRIIGLSKDINTDIIPSKVSSNGVLEKCPPNNNKIYNNSYIIRGTKTQTVDKMGVERKGVLDNNDIYNIPILYSTPKNPSNISDNIYNIKAINNRDVAYLKDKYGNGNKKIFTNNQEFMNYIRKDINLGEVLEFNYPKSIKCIFHDDNSNSAGIFQAEDGAWIYNCFGCGVTYNIVGVIERLANFKSRPQTYKFIKEIFNLEIMDTEWQKEQKEILLENLKIINSSEFEDNSPQASKNIKRIKHYLEQLILIAMDNVHNENLTDDDGQVVFFTSGDYLAKQMGISPNSLNKIYQKLVVLTYHRLLNKLDDDDLPEKFLKRAKAISINSGKTNHVNFFSIPSYTVNQFIKVEERGKQWKENHYTMKGVSREMFYRAEGLDIANELYPQYKKVTKNIDGENKVLDRTTTKTSNKRTNNIVGAIYDLFNEQGYATEKDIVNKLKNKYRYFITEVQIKKSLKEILDNYDLDRIRANKEIKEQYGVVSKGYPFIIIKK